MRYKQVAFYKIYLGESESQQAERVKHGGRFRPRIDAATDIISKLAVSFSKDKIIPSYNINNGHVEVTGYRIICNSEKS
jgi:hypothetical protein